MSMLVLRKTGQNKNDASAIFKAVISVQNHRFFVVLEHLIIESKDMEILLQ